MDYLQAYRKSKNPEDLAALFNSWQRRVFRMCMHYLKHVEDSEDAVVDIFLELREALLKHDVQNFPSWLHTVVRNHCLKKLRKKARLLVADEDFIPELMESRYESDRMDSMLDVLPDAIDQIEERQRWCIVLFYLQGKTYKEIEEIKGYSSMEVKSAIQNGKIQLKKILSKYVS